MHKILNKIFLFIIVSMLILPNFILPVSATTEAKKVYSISFDGVKINSVDTNADGSMAFVGLENGTIFSINNLGSVIYSYAAQSHSNSAIKKIKSDVSGDLAWLTKGGDTGYLNPNGTLLYGWYITPGTYNVSDVDIDIGRNPGLWWKIQNTSAHAYIRGMLPDGSVPYQDNGYGTAIWTTMAYDSQNGVIVLTNGSSNGGPSNTIYMYNITDYNGWVDFNPTKAARNTTLQLLDSFPYRQDIALNNGVTDTISLRFLDTPTASGIVYNGNGTFSYNSTRDGKYMLWTYTGNISTSQNFVNLSYYNSTLHQLIVSTKPTVLGNSITCYFGNLAYNNTILTAVSNVTFDTVVSSNSTGWTAPANAQYISSVSVAGGGAGGTGGWYAHSGWGGSASVPTTIANYGNIAPGNYFAFSIGTPGSGGVGSAGGSSVVHDGTDGSSTTAFGLTSNGALGSAHQGTANGASNAGMGGGSATPGLPGAGAGQGNGGTGWGAGAGGGGMATFLGSGGNGGSGSSGGVTFTYQTWVPGYYSGMGLSLSSLGPEQSSTSSSALIYTASLALTGNATAISIPEGGGVVGISTSGVSSGDTGKFYLQEITANGFGAQHSVVSQTGIGYHIATSDSGTFSIEARGSEFDIYAIDGTLKGQYVSGGTVNSVDISAKNGLWAIGGGNDGKVYMMSKDAQSLWYVYFQGDSSTPIETVAMSDRGEYAAVGRIDGQFEYYSVQSTVAGTGNTNAVFSVDTFITKGAVAYPNVVVSITELSNTVPQIPTGTNISSMTDSTGKVTFSATEQKYYLISINNGEYTQTYQASPTYKVVSINIPLPLVNRAYQYDAKYNDTTHTITSTYTDVNNADVNIQIIDMQSTSTVHYQDYLGTRNVIDNFVVANTNDSYKVLFNFTRTSGAHYADTVYVQSSLFNAIPRNTSNQYTLFIYAVYTLLLMAVSLSVTTQSLKYGVVLLVALTFLGITLGFLPLSLYTAGISTSCFIAMLEVFRRRE